MLPMIRFHRCDQAVALCAIPIFVSLAVTALAQDITLRGTSKVVFASRDEARTLLTTRDEFVSRLSAFDRSARLKTDRPVDEASYLKYVSEQVLDWTDAEKAAIKTALSTIDGELSKLKLQLPAQISMIKTTGAEEGDAAYTRGAAIIVPQSKVKAASAGLAALMAHELFHVLSRHDVSLRERLYKAIGFHQCAELKMPAPLAARRITNPDAPAWDHYIQIKVDDREVPAVPVLYANTDNYDIKRGGEFFNYLVFEFLVIESPGSSSSTFTAPQMKEGKPILINPGKAGGFIDQVGRNTQYLIHPDEILADNFMLLVTRSDKVKSPEVLARISACFQ